MKKISLKLNNITVLDWQLIKEAPKSGPFDDYVEWILSTYDVEMELDDSIEYLRGFGAWDMNELQDLETNKARVLWLAIMDCKERGDNYFYMGE